MSLEFGFDMDQSKPANNSYIRLEDEFDRSELDF